MVRFVNNILGLMILLVLATGSCHTSVTPSEIKCPLNCDCISSRWLTESVDIKCTNINLSYVENVPKNIGLLDLSHNDIPTLRNESLKMFLSLLILYLQSSGIHDIEGGTFIGMDHVEKIDLSNNYLIYLDSKIFEHLTKLQTLSLNGNPLVNMNTNYPVIVSPYIKYIYFRRCSITSLSENSFSKLPSLEVLDLSANKLKDIKSSYFNTLTNLQFIDLSNNPWSCQCELIEVLDWFNKPIVTETVSRKKHKPVHCLENGKFKRFWSATNKNRHCEITTVSSTPVIKSKTYEIAPKYHEYETTTDFLIYVTAEMKKNSKNFEHSNNEILPDNSSQTESHSMKIMFINLSIIIAYIILLIIGYKYWTTCSASRITCNNNNNNNNIPQIISYEPIKSSSTLHA